MNTDNTPTLPDPSNGPPKPPTTPPPPSMMSANRNTILMTLGGAMALAVPTSIHEIGSPLVRSIVGLIGVVVVFALGYFVTPRKK